GGDSASLGLLCPSGAGLAATRRAGALWWATYGDCAPRDAAASPPLLVITGRPGAPARQVILGGGHGAASAVRAAEAPQVRIACAHRGKARGQPLAPPGSSSEPVPPRRPQLKHRGTGRTGSRAVVARRSNGRSEPLTRAWRCPTLPQAT